MLLLSGALLGLGYGTTSSSVQAIAVNASPKHRIGLATSTNFIFQDLGVGIGPFFTRQFRSINGLPRIIYANDSNRIYWTVLILFAPWQKNDICK